MWNYSNIPNIALKFALKNANAELCLSTAMNCLIGNTTAVHQSAETSVTAQIYCFFPILLFLKFLTRLCFSPLVGSLACKVSLGRGS